MAFATPDSLALDVKRIAAISLDLDDTLWPIWPTIERAVGSSGEPRLHQSTAVRSW